MNGKSIEETMKLQAIKYQTTQKCIQFVSDLGFMMYEPAYFESYDRFVLSHQRVNKESMVKLINPSKEVLLLRPDVTTSIASNIVPLLNDKDELKLFYYATMFRQTESKIAGRKQFGIEWFNAKEDEAEKDVLRLILDLFKSFEMPFILEIGSEAFLKTLFDQLSLTKQESELLKEMIAYKDEDRLKAWVKTKSFSQEYRDLLNTLFRLQGTPAKLKQRLHESSLPKPLNDSALELLNILSAFTEKEIRFDLSMISEFEYYTGLRFKVYLENYPKTVLKGGRYLAVNPYGDEARSAIGFSMDTDAVIKELVKRG